MNEKAIFTYQTRLMFDEKPANILSEYACLFNKVEHALYAKTASGKTSASRKNSFLKKYGMTARPFNACRMNLEGKIAACRVGQERAIMSLKLQIDALNKKNQFLENKPSKRFVLHQKKRRRHCLLNRLTGLERDNNQGRVCLCFGGKKLFKAQFYLKQNGFSSQLERKKVCEANRSSEFFALGSKDEKRENQTCTAHVQDNGRLTLRLRLPVALEEKYGKYLEMKDVFFAYGQKAVLSGLNNPTRQALSYRLKKDEKNWRIYVSTDLKKADPVSQERIGAIGIDLNTDHIACIETDRLGNPVHRKVIPWLSYGKSKGQVKAVTGDICKQIVERAKQTKKPLVIEILDFKKKKADLAEKGENKFSPLLSSVAYGLFFRFLIAGAFRNGTAVHRVNSAYTSVIGRINYALRYVLSIHLAAALSIARRYQKFSEAPCSPAGKIQDGKEGHVALVLPKRNRTRHVWHFWGQVKKKLSTVLAAHFRAKKNLILESVKTTLEISNSRLLTV